MFLSGMYITTNVYFTTIYTLLLSKSGSPRYFWIIHITTNLYFTNTYTLSLRKSDSPRCPLIYNTTNSYFTNIYILPLSKSGSPNFFLISASLKALPGLAMAPDLVKLLSLAVHQTCIPLVTGSSGFWLFVRLVYICVYIYIHISCIYVHVYVYIYILQVYVYIYVYNKSQEHISRV